MGVELSLETNIVNCVRASRQIENLIRKLKSMGITLSVGPTGRLRYDAPESVLTDELLDQLRRERDGILAHLRTRTSSDRQTLGADDSRMLNADTKNPTTSGAHYLAPMAYVCCPWCQSKEMLFEHKDGLFCDMCRRKAWHDDGVTLCRADFLDDRFFQ